MSKLQIEKYSISAKEFKRQVATIPDDWTIIFGMEGTPIDFSEFKIRGEKLTQM